MSTITAPQRTGGAGLSLRNLSKSFGANQVLTDLSIEIEAGKLLSLLGPSGCGKTTTLNMIAGFLEPDSGSILLGGKDISHTRPNKRDTAIVFQNYALFPHLTVFENISYGLKIRKLAKSAVQTRTNTMLDMLNIGHLAERFPSQLSGGQQQRVSLARALAVEPSLLLLDEPLSNLDAKLRQDIRIEIRRFQQELNQTAVFVTHDQDEALAISDYIAVLNSGWLEQIGSPEELWEKPKTVYVADFMGVENILPVVSEGGHMRLNVGGENANVRIPGCSTVLSHVGFRSSTAQLVNNGERDSSKAYLSGVIRSATYTGNGFRYKVGAGLEKDLTVEQLGHHDVFAPGTPATIQVDASTLLPLSESPLAA